MKIKACMYHDENDTIDVLTMDGMKMCILCAAIEDSLHTDIISRSKLIRLKENEPSTYAELVIKGGLQGFLEQYAESYHRLTRSYKKTAYSAF